MVNPESLLSVYFAGFANSFAAFVYSINFAPFVAIAIGYAGGGYFVGFLLDRLLVWFFGVFNRGFERGHDWPTPGLSG